MTRVYATTGFGERPGEAFAYDLRIAGGSLSLLPALDRYLQGTGSQAESGAASVGGDGSMPMWLAATPSGKLAYTVDMSGEGSVHAHHIAAHSSAVVMADAVTVSTCGAALAFKLSIGMSA